MKIKIIDDNPKDQKALQALLEEWLLNHHLQADISLSEKLGFVGQSNPEFDLVFMDVELEKESGLDNASFIHKQYPSALVVLTSSFSHHSIAGYQTGAVRFLPKPFSAEQMEMILDADFIRLLEKSGSIYHPLLHTVPIPIRSIVYIEAMDRKTVCHLANGKAISTGLTLKEFKDLCEPYPFIQVYKSLIVNMMWIETILPEQREILLKTKEKIPFSRHYKKELQEAYRNYSWTTL